MPAGNSDAEYNLPVEPGKLLLVKGGTLKKILQLLKRGRVTTMKGDPLTASTTDAGTCVTLASPDGKLAFKSVKVDFCEGGVRGYRYVIASDFTANP